MGTRCRTAKYRKVRPFWVVGLKVRTDRLTENDPEAARIPGAWMALLNEGRMFRMTRRVNRIEYLALYTDYEPANHNAFSVIVGQRVVAPAHVPGGLEPFHFPGGDYLVFPARGEGLAAVDQAYQEAELFFATNPEWSRLWTTDYEVSGKVWNQTDIYIAVKRFTGEA